MRGLYMPYLVPRVLFSAINKHKKHGLLLWQQRKHFTETKFTVEQRKCLIQNKVTLALQRRHLTQKHPTKLAEEFRPDLPLYTLKDLQQHTTKENRVWMSFKAGVYDITDYVDQHPGGDQILLAAGNSADPFWRIYTIHDQPQIYELFETYRIGNLKKEDRIQQQTVNIDDPFAKEPERHPVMVKAIDKPYNAEPPCMLLCENFITPNELYFVRNHLPVPEIDPNTYELKIEVEGTEKTLTFNLEQLKKLPKHTITATLMCAGTRRLEMDKMKPGIAGPKWGIASVGNATWTGARLVDILEMMGITEQTVGNYKHVHFEGVDSKPSVTPYAASIPIWKAVDRKCDVIVAYEMNGVPLPKDHGYPVRMVVPGAAGARSTKWLGKILVSETENQTHWHQELYKGFSPSITKETVDYSTAPAIQEMPVTSAICRPSHGETVWVEDGNVTIKGYAWSGGGRKIIRVDITLDQGKTWHIANLVDQDSAEPPQHWAWTLWSAKIPVDDNVNEVEIWAKAVDSSYNVQPETLDNIWNFRGNLGNHYHRVKIRLKR